MRPGSDNPLSVTQALHDRVGLTLIPINGRLLTALQQGRSSDGLVGCPPGTITHVDQPPTAGRQMPAGWGRGTSARGLCTIGLDHGVGRLGLMTAPGKP